jgi:hypothetical protein
MCRLAIELLDSRVVGIGITGRKLVERPVGGALMIVWSWALSRPALVR